MTYVRIDLCRSGSFCRRSFASASIRSPFRLFLPLRRCPFLMRGLLRKSRIPGIPLLPPSLPSEGWDEGGGGSRVALVLLPEGLPLLLLDFCPAGGVEEPLDARSVHASSLLSSRFVCGLGRQELLSRGGLLLPFSVPVGSPSSSLHTLRGDGAGESSGAFSYLLPFLVHLCTLCEVVRRGSLPSSAPVRIPPWLPDLQLGKPGRCCEPTLGRIALVIGLVAHAVAPLSVLG